MITYSLPLDLSLGWQPGIQEAAADWDEGWDKFDNEGMLNNCLLDLVDFDFALEGLEFLFTRVHDAFFSALSLNLVNALTNIVICDFQDSHLSKSSPWMYEML
jgi:hypothetical protein